MRQCEFCLSQTQSTGPIEDEIHMLYKCKLVEELRRNALPRLTTLLHTRCGILANRFKFIIASMLPPPTIKISHKDAVEIATACGNYIHKIHGTILIFKKGITILKPVFITIAFYICNYNNYIILID